MKLDNTGGYGNVGIFSWLLIKFTMAVVWSVIWIDGLILKVKRKWDG